MLESGSAYFQQAVIILTEPEAREICEGKTWIPNARQIVPAQWKNIEPEKFTAWLEALQVEAKTVSEEKERIEAQFQSQSQRLQELRNYYQQHTYAEYQELYATQQELANKIDVFMKQLDNLTTGKIRVIQAIDNQEKRQTILAEEFQLLMYRIKEAEKYLGYHQSQQDLLAVNQILYKEIAQS